MQIVDIDDERSSLAVQALGLIEQAFDARDRHSIEDLRSAMAEVRLGLIAPYAFHVLGAVEDGRLIGTAIGTYLAGINAGFVNYLAVTESGRGQGTGRLLRRGLVRRCRAEAVRAGHTDLAWMLGEVRSTNPWLKRLVRKRGAIPFHFEYYHPGMRPGAEASAYVLYRQPVGDRREALPSELVRRILYAIYRRAYRVRYPLQHPGFLAMLEQLEGREGVGAHPDV